VCIDNALHIDQGSAWELLLQSDAADGSTGERETVLQVADVMHALVFQHTGTVFHRRMVVPGPGTVRADLDTVFLKQSLILAIGVLASLVRVLRERQSWLTLRVLFPGPSVSGRWSSGLPLPNRRWRPSCLGSDPAAPHSQTIPAHCQALMKKVAKIWRIP